ncbi:MAG: hypothetical protein ACRBG0_21455 [Lewinella sp.]|uniref:hypothetical protein n=1 Tax=Lewinella sp. TaxID=2004506 RepID=UPI003D6B6995
MNSQRSALSSKNTAIRHISGDSVRGILPQEDIKVVAAKNTANVDNSEVVNNEIEEVNKSEERNVLWYALGISVGVVLLAVVALKFKLIKI